MIDIIIKLLFYFAFIPSFAAWLVFKAAND